MIERYTREQMGKIWSDEYRFRKQLDVEIAVCRAWGSRGVIPKDDLDVILKKADFDLNRVYEIEKTTNHETVALIEAISEKVGPASRWIHVGLTSSDILDTSFTLQIMGASDILLDDLRELRKVTGEQALKYKDTLCIGRTHGVHAEPITFGLKLLVWHEELGRDIERLERAKEVMRVGKISGAVGTWAFLEPSIEVEALGHLGLKPCAVTNQVIQRDRYAEYLAALAITAGTFDKIATEIRHLQRTEVREAAEPFGKGQKGSSAMPHKRNPMTCERVTGLARVVRGNLQVALENQALWHERDISHSSAERVIFPDSCIIIDYLSSKLTNIIRNLDVNPERMMENLELTKGAVFSQRVLLALAESGMKREDAYPIVQTAAHTAIREGTDFRDEIRRNPTVQERIGDKLDELFDYGYFVRWRDEAFKRAGLIRDTHKGLIKNGLIHLEDKWANDPSYKFLSSLLQRAAKRTDIHSRAKAKSKHWVGVSAGMSGVNFNYVIRRHDAIVSLDIENVDEGVCRRIFHSLKSNRLAIEKKIGRELVWSEKRGRRVRRIQIFISNGGRDDVEMWVDIQDAMIGAMIELERGLRPYLKKLL